MSDNYKVILIKYENEEILLEKIKIILQDYDMYLIESDENKHVFDRDGSYSRTFILNPPVNGWITMYDDDEQQWEQMAQELSQLIECLVLGMGIFKDMLYYTVYRSGDVAGEFMSNFKYYEYEVDDAVIDRFKGERDIFEEIVSADGADSIKEALDSCREGNLEAAEACHLILSVIGVIPQKDNDDAEQEQKEEKINPLRHKYEETDEPISIDMNDIFYVDFESINLRIADVGMVIDAIKQICNEMGYINAEDASCGDKKKGGLFKKIFNAVKETKRVQFFISPVNSGWVTLVGEIETLLGSEPTSWDFVHIEGELSQILERDIVNIYANAEKWGFKVFRKDDLICEYNSDVEYSDLNSIEEILTGNTDNELEELLNEAPENPNDINEIFIKFCSVLGIENYKINIPMDFSIEEFKTGILDRLPDGDKFTSLKFVKNK